MYIYIFIYILFFYCTLKNDIVPASRAISFFRVQSILILHETKVLYLFYYIPADQTSQNHPLGCAKVVKYFSFLCF